MQNHSIIKLIQQSNYLPVIPKELGEILNMLQDPYSYDIDECIIKLSGITDLEKNLISALNYKLNRKSLTLKDAVLYLGANNTRMIAIAYITRLMLPDRKGRTKQFNRKIYWKHCIATSIASHNISAETGLCDKDRLFTYGLIHDIGITVLDICLPEHLDKIYAMQLEQKLHHIVAEKIVLDGITHAEIGMWICKEWGLPEEITDVVGYHHTPFINNKTSNELKIMHLADSISTNYYEKLLGDDKGLLYLDKTRELLNLSREFVDSIAATLPEKVDKVSRIINFDI